MSQSGAEQAGKIERRVEAAETAGKPARTVVVQRTYPTDMEDLWHAIVDPERLERWFLPVSGDLREGGRYQLQGNAGGTIDRCEPPTSLAVSWEMNGGVSWVTLSLQQLAEDATQLTLEHLSEEDAAFLEFWNQYGPGAVGIGWDTGFFALAEHIESKGEAPPFDEESWMQSADGRSFALASNEGWIAASKEFGTDAKAAEEAGTRIAAFYTGEEPQ